MGGDHAPFSVLRGAEEALKRYPDIYFLIYGDENQIRPILRGLSKLKEKSKIIHTEKYILNDEKPSIAIRQGKGSSMYMAIESVKNSEAVGMVSAGNTGALMVLSKLILKTLPGIDRPAIVTIFPTVVGECVLLDLGANIECTGDNLFQFAVMGDAFARAVLGLTNPKIGLLNIGTEEMKGHEELKEAAQLLKETKLPLNFYGYIEGNDISQSVVDVVVTDGFSGNIALKTAEGTAKISAHFLKDAFMSSWLSKLGYLLAKPALKTLFNKLDPRLYNGAMFVGINGIVVKSHGGTDWLGFCNAIGVTHELATHKINDHITKEIQDSHTKNHTESA